MRGESCRTGGHHVPEPERSAGTGGAWHGSRVRSCRDRRLPRSRDSGSVVRERASGRRCRRSRRDRGGPAIRARRRRSAGSAKVAAGSPSRRSANSWGTSSAGDALRWPVSTSRTDEPDPGADVQRRGARRRRRGSRATPHGRRRDPRRGCSRARTCRRGSGSRCRRCAAVERPRAGPSSRPG